VHFFEIAAFVPWDVGVYTKKTAPLHISREAVGQNTLQIFFRLWTQGWMLPQMLTSDGF